MAEKQGRIRRASPQDLHEILKLLDSNDLPTIGVDQHLHQFLVWEMDTTDSIDSYIGGCVGLELYGKHALLRSLSVHFQYQGKGIGTQLLNSIIRQAKDMDIRNLYLLTTTASEFFDKQNFMRISRNDAPDVIKASLEFSNICPSTAICMTRNLET